MLDVGWFSFLDGKSRLHKHSPYRSPKRGCRKKAYMLERDAEFMWKARSTWPVRVPGPNSVSRAKSVEDIVISGVWRATS
jgi:hypothetical protein